MSQQPQYFIGIMSGTSLDGIDTVLADLSNEKIQLINAQTTPYSATIKLAIETLIGNDHCSFQLLCQTDRNLALLYADSVKTLIKKTNVPTSNITAIGCHGQTIKHAPDHSPAYTLQLGDPSSIAALTGITTIADFRRKDIALGGQGAPFAPAFHHFAFHNQQKTRVILNIGGIANITLLNKSARADQIIGFDTGPGNTLMDHYCRQYLQQDFDHNGELANKGTINTELIDSILKNEPYFASPPSKSTGTDHFNLKWLSQFIDISTLKKEDALANLTEISAQSIYLSLQHLALPIDEIFCCGGGCYNQTLIQRISTLCKTPIETTGKLGIHPDWIEALAFAWLAKNTLKQKPTPIMSFTGASNNSVLGGVYFP